MRWLSKFENGGQVDVIQQVCQGLIDSPQETLQQLQQMGEQGQKVMQTIVQLAKRGDQLAVQALQTVQSLMQEPMSAKKGAKLIHRLRNLEKEKCGGKAKKATKASNGSKMKCPCTLKRVGGKLIEVDCYGIPVAKKGTKVKKCFEGDELNQRNMKFAKNQDALTGTDQAPAADASQDRYYTKNGKWYKQSYTQPTDKTAGSWGEGVEITDLADEGLTTAMKDTGFFVDGYDSKTGLFTEDGLKAYQAANPNYKGYTTRVSNAGGSYRINADTDKLIDGRQASDRDMKRAARQQKKLARKWANANWNNEAINWTDAAGNSVEAPTSAKDLKNRMGVSIGNHVITNGLNKGTKTSDLKGGNYMQRYLYNMRNVNDMAGAASAPMNMAPFTISTTQNASTPTNTPTDTNAPTSKRSFALKQGGWLKKFEPTKK